MFDPKILDDISQRVTDALPASLGHLKEEMEKNMHAILQSVLGKLDLVTREELDIQKGVLAKTRSKLEALEKRVAELEAQILK